MPNQKRDKEALLRISETLQMSNQAQSSEKLLSPECVCVWNVTHTRESVTEHHIVGIPGSSGSTHGSRRASLVEEL